MHHAEYFCLPIMSNRPDEKIHAQGRIDAAAERIALDIRHNRQGQGDDKSEDQYRIEPLRGGRQFGNLELIAIVGLKAFRAAKIHYCTVLELFC